MSEPRHISPMLDGCIIGEAISCHNGVRCCPAIRQSTGEKYIVKIISIPASQVQLEALLLTGAYENKEAAQNYFLELAQEILKEKDVLSSLSQLEGFTGYVDAQVEPMEDGVGYEVYLLSPYRRSVERILATDQLTHLGVVNMGLDLCAALAACRRAGYLYVDLKPENIFLTPEQDYRIGDLGFVPLSSLRYATLPEKFHSPYAPAEVLDPMAVLGDTVDTYALGLILYQAYNGGQLPAPQADGSPLPAPLYADYEMAEIILKACNADPTGRWSDPAQMGQALVGYLQRNTVNDDPIIPPVLEPGQQEAPAEAVEEFLPEREPEPEELAFLQELTSDETAPSEENTQELHDAPVTEETSQMLAQADDLICHELPEPVVAPEAVEVPMPEPIEVPMPQITLTPPEAEPAEAPAEQAPEVPEEPTEAASTDAPAEPETPEEKQEKKHGPNIRVLLSVLLLLIALACASLGGWYYYNNIYLQPIRQLTVDGTESILTVRIDSDISEELLTVYCIDVYGNSVHSPVTAGVAVFQNLHPSTRYTIRVEIGGLHKLTGQTTASFTTDAQLDIENFQAIIGATDGSALLSFQVSGNEGSGWLLTYGAAGIPEKTVSFTGHSVSVGDLVLGAEYTFTLASQDGLHLNGTTQTKLTAGKLLFAQDLTITACGGGALSVRWNAPEGESVSSWTIRCYNESGYSQTVTTDQLNYTFTGMDHNSTCTVEIFATNMSQSTFVTVGPNPVTITGFTFDDSVFGMLKLTWSYTGGEPDGGWIVSYAADGLSPQTISTDKAEVQLYAIPGSSYTFTVQATDGTSVFSGTTTHDTPEAAPFNAYGLSADTIEGRLCLRPEGQYWSQAHVPAENYRNVFSAGQKAGLVLHALKVFDYSQEEVQISYMIRSSDGTLVHMDSATSIWDNIFPGAYGALNIPFMPEEAGEYTITIYFNGKFVTVQSFRIA